jgi:hypothetical protein
VPSGKVNVPTLKKPKVDLNAPDLDINGPSGKLKMPKFGLSGKMPKSTKLNLKSPKIKGGIDSPDMHLPDADLKAPKLDVNPPELDINASPGKFKMPKFRGLKRPDVDIDGDLEGPDININTPTANLKGHKTGLKMPDLKMPDFGLSGPNVVYDLPNIDLSAPKLKGRFETT